MFGLKAKCNVWLRQNTQNTVQHPDNTISAIKGGGSSILLSYFSSGGPGNIVAIKGNMDGAKKKQILKRVSLF